MLNSSISQLMTIALLKQLNRLNADREDDVIDSRVDELNKEHIETQEYQELRERHLELLKTVRNTEDEEQRNKALFELSDLTVDMMFETAKFYYMAGFNDGYFCFPSGLIRFFYLKM
jgi:hypothetical protein